MRQWEIDQEIERLMDKDDGWPSSKRAPSKPVTPPAPIPKPNQGPVMPDRSFDGSSFHEDNPPHPKEEYDKLEAYFPFPAMRQGQLEVLTQLKAYLLDPKIKVIIMEAPVGTGKSGYAMAAARASQLAYISTANKLLQEQYQRDFKSFLADLKGRANYKCYTHTDQNYNCSNSPCRKTKSAQEECSKIKNCEFHHQLRKASQSNLTAFNFAAFLPFVNYVRKYFGHRNLVVIDEAHQLPDWITKFVELKFNRAELMGLGLTADLPDYESVDFYEKYIDDIRTKISDTLNDEEISEGLEAQTREDLEALYKKIALFRKLMEAPNGASNFAILKEYDKKINTVLHSVGFKPIVIAKVAQDYLFSHSNKTLLLSATILDFQTYTMMLGLEHDQVGVIRVGSSFPKENRPFYTGAIVGNFNMKNLDMYLPQIVSRIEQIMDHYPNVKGIIHGGSYKICNYIAQNLKNSGRLLYPSAAKDQKNMLDLHLNGSRPTILLSPSMTEGVDLKDDASRFQIIVKMPFPYLGDPVVEKRMEIYPQYYDMQTALTLVQAYGRSVRSETDWAHTYILDGCFWNFLNRNRQVFPSWFLEAIQ